MEDILRNQVIEVFNYNLKNGLAMLKAIPENKYCSFPGIKINHAAWLVGHIAFTHRNAANLLGANISIPDGWRELFRGGSEPIDDPARYPAKEILIDSYIQGHNILLNSYKNAGLELLAATNDKY